MNGNTLMVLLQQKVNSRKFQTFCFSSEIPLVYSRINDNKNIVVAALQSLARRQSQVIHPVEIRP